MVGGAIRALCPPTQSTPKAEGTRRPSGWPRLPSHVTNREMQSPQILSSRAGTDSALA